MNAQGLKAARKKSKMSLQQLSEIINVDRATIGKWERGVSSPMGDNLKKWCDALGLELAAINKEPGTITIHQL